MNIFEHIFRFILDVFLDPDFMESVPTPVRIIACIITAGVIIALFVLGIIGRSWILIVLGVLLLILFAFVFLRGRGSR